MNSVRVFFYEINYTIGFCICFEYFDGLCAVVGFFYFIGGAGRG